MNAGMPQKLSDPYLYEPADDWLYWALLKVNRLPENNKTDKALNSAARIFLRTIEAELLPTPGVWRSPLDRVHVKFAFGSRSVEFVICPQGYWAVRSSPGETWAHKSCKGWPGQFARDEIRWVFPTACMTDYKGMVATSRGQ